VAKILWQQVAENAAPRYGATEYVVAKYAVHHFLGQQTALPSAMYIRDGQKTISNQEVIGGGGGIPTKIK